MKFLIYISLVCFLFSHCKSKQVVTTTAVVPEGKTKGTVSHKYKNTGCNTVVIISKDGVETTLIPHPALSVNFDQEGREIYFTFRKLRIHNPEGCTAGTPAEINNVE